jgi:HAD superfamily hydrolase (TIGR01509 family)
MIPVDTLFDLVVDSSEIGVRKPDPEIYRFALNALGGVAPERAVFLDDHQGNIDAALAVGLQGVLVEAESTSALAALERILSD